MALDKTTKIVLVLGGLVGVGGLVYWLATRNKDGSGSGSGGGGLFGDRLTMGYLQNGYIHIEGDDRAKAKPLIVKGTPIKIKKTDFDGEYVVDKVWMDSNGNVGGFTTTQTSIPNNKTTDRRFQGKGVIIVK